MSVAVFSISSHVPLGEAGSAKSLLLKRLKEIPRGGNLVGFSVRSPGFSP